uniref:Lim domain containing protein n=1 Tax=Melanopsichium pennsylvanicum 4 TaxID=1398559 RepID=A0A077R390_9BASI|nr:lim domain containing protein [Melanopsichium pennsylvanicum 4]
MVMYHSAGSTTVESDNLAGFGARRFMQDMYQQNNHYQRGHNDYTHHVRQPSDHVAHGLQYDQRYQDRHYHQSRSRIQDHQQYHQTKQQTVVSEAAAVANTSAPYAGTHLKSVGGFDSCDSAATESKAGLEFTRNGDSPYLRNEPLKPFGAFDNSRSVMPNNKFVDRATIYDDDYEESVHIATSDTMPRLSSPASATLGNASTDASLTIVRATVLEPGLPKAKCADCGEKLDFEELANHSCQPAGVSKPPLLTIQVPPSSSSSTLSSTSTSPACTSPRLPFFDRYDTLINETGPLSPALLGTVMPAGSTQAHEDDETPKAHAVRIMGVQAAVKVSHIKSTTQTDSVHAGSQRVPLPTQAPAIQRSVSDTEAGAAAARRKMIEDQRAAKRKENMASPLPRAATSPCLAKQSVTRDDRRKETSRQKASSSPIKRNCALPGIEAQHAKTGSSSSSLSTGTDSSERMGLSSGLSFGSRAGGSLASKITPSSSYERIDDGVDGHHTTPIKDSGSALFSKQSRERGGVDLSGIEEMMKGLTASLESSQRNFMDAPRKSSNSHEANLVTAQRPRSATSVNKTHRERFLELELERLRDKERTRQLQALRLKEKKRKERAAKRCCICDCSLSSSRTPFVERDGKLLCARDWKELYLPKCRKCNLTVEKGAVKSSDGALRDTPASAHLGDDEPH